MSDDTNVQEPDGSSTPPDSEELTALKKKLAELEAAVEAEKARKADAIAERDKEREKRKKEAEAKGQYDEAKRLLDERLAELETQNAELKALESYRDKWTSYESERRKSLLALLPDDRRAKFETADISLLEEVVALLPQKNGPGDVPGRGGGAAPGSKSWADMTEVERIQLMESDPALARAKTKEFLKTSRR